MNANPPSHLPPGEPETAETRTARHLRYCRDLADLTMQLARAAAEKALLDWQSSEAAEPDPEAPIRKTPEPGLLFVRLSRAVRDIIALETRIAAGSQPARATTPALAETPAASVPEDPRRAVLIRVLHDATKFHPRRAEIHRGIIERVDSDLAADPGYESPPEPILVAISEDLGIELDYDKMSDQTLEDLSPKRFRTPASKARAAAAAAAAAAICARSPLAQIGSQHHASPS